MYYYDLPITNCTNHLAHRALVEVKAMDRFFPVQPFHDTTHFPWKGKDNSTVAALMAAQTPGTGHCVEVHSLFFDKVA